MSAVRHAKPGILARLSRKPAPAPVPSGHIPFETAPSPVLPRRVVDRESVAAGLRARRDLTRQRDIPTTLLSALRAWQPTSVAALQDYASEPAMEPYWNPGGTVAADLAGIAPGEQWTAPRSAFVADLTELPHFRATCKTRGWCGLAMRKNDATTAANAVTRGEQ